MDTAIKIGIITCSDRASKGVYDDISGREIERLLRLFLRSSFEVKYRLISDEQSIIEQTLIELCDTEHCCLVVTTGGTGPTPRDVTPEATENICEKMLPGFGEQMRSVSLQYVPTAILSRQTAGIRGSTLIINLPGKPKSIQECLESVFPAVPYCIDLISGPYLEVNEANITVFRPKQSNG